MTPQTPDVSKLERTLAFSSDAALRDKHVNNRGDVRFGLLLELLDNMAGGSAWKYVGEHRKDLTIVTASCDRIDICKPVAIDRDLHAKALVNYVGRSSMEVGVKLESGTDKVASAHFTMVCLDDTLAPTPVPSLTPVTPEEQRRYADAERRKQEWLAARNARSQPPTAEESKLIHDLHLQRHAGKPSGVPMARTEYSNLDWMFPQDKNNHNTVFGGYLMRIAYEHAWNVGYLHAGNRPLIASVDRIDFLRPVQLGTLVQMHAGVRHVGQKSMQVEVGLQEVDPSKCSSRLTNTCWFTFVAPDASGALIDLSQVYPETYAQALQYIEGRRRYEQNKARRARP